MIGETPTARTRLVVWKVSGGHDLELVGRSAEPLTFRVHWLGRRSYMCPGVDCPACEQHVGSKWLGLWACDAFYRIGEPPRLGLLELTEGAFDCLRMLRLSEGLESFYGLRVIASRRSKRSVLQFELGALGANVESDRQLVPINLVADAAATLFGLPSCQRDVEFSTWEASAMDVARTLIGRALATMAREG